MLSFIWDSNLGLILILAWMFNTSELDELFQILNSIKGFKLRQPQWSNTTAPTPDGLFQIKIDTSREGMGGTLLQKQGDE